MSIFTYQTRLHNVLLGKKAEYFTPSEIINAIVNLLDAKQELSANEFFFVSVVYEVFNKMKNKLLLNREGFMGLCDDMTAHLDLIAPYYKFCGDPTTMFAWEMIDKEKKPYRKRAKILLDRNEFFTPEWMKLHQEFLEEFYPKD